MQDIGFIWRNQENISNNINESTQIRKEIEKNKRLSINILPTEAKTNIDFLSDYKTENNRITPTKYVPFWINDFEEKKKNEFILNISSSEKYSLLKIKKIKENKFSPFNSTSKLFKEENNSFDTDIKENISNQYIYYSIIKRKKISSVKKYFESNISFIGKNNKIKYFQIYRDCEIGIEENWQKNQTIIFQDDDINSEEDEISKGKQICFVHIKEAITLKKKNRKEK
jgi:hypothetical protein